MTKYNSLVPLDNITKKKFSHNNIYNEIYEYKRQNKKIINIYPYNLKNITYNLSYKLK